MYTINAGGSHTKELAFSRDGRFFAAAGQKFSIVDTTTGKIAASVDPVWGAIDVAISPDGKHAATLGYFGTVLLLNTETGSTITVQRDDVYSFDGNEHVLFSPDGKNLLFTNIHGDTATVRIGDQSAIEHVLIKERTPMAFSPDGKVLAVVNHNTNTVQLFRFGDSPTLIKQFNMTNVKQIIHVALSPDGKLVGISSEDEDQSGSKVTIWNIADGALVRTFNIPNGYLGARMSFSPDSKELQVSCGPNGANIYRLSDGELLATLPRFINEGWLDEFLNGIGKKCVSSAVFTPDGKSVYYAFFAKGRLVAVKWRAP